MNPEISNQPTPDPRKDEKPVRLQSQGAPNGIFLLIQHITAWVMIVSAILFALIGVLAIWEVFGQNTGDVIWRAFSSLAVIAFAALIVNVASRASEGKH